MRFCATAACRQSGRIATQHNEKKYSVIIRKKNEKRFVKSVEHVEELEKLSRLRTTTISTRQHTAESSSSSMSRTARQPSEWMRQGRKVKKERRRHRWAEEWVRTDGDKWIVSFVWTFFRAAIVTSYRCLMILARTFDAAVDTFGLVRHQIGQTLLRFSAIVAAKWVWNDKKLR